MKTRPNPEGAALWAGPSKTQLKRDVTELQDLSLALLDLPDTQLDEIEMEDKLREALRTLRGMRSNEARRRQAQYVGKLMRNAEDGPIRAAIEAHRMGTTRAAKEFQGIEQWRERLIASDEGLTDWIAEYPQTDAQQLRTMIRNARREALVTPTADGPTGGVRKGRAYRELFQRLRTEIEATAGASRNDGDESAD